MKSRLKSVVSLFTALAFWLLTLKAPNVRLKDGSTLRLEFVRYQRNGIEGGPRTRMDTVRGWLGKILGLRTYSRHFISPDSLVFWISRRQKDTGRYMDFD